jgi:hypothetical protein
MLRAQTGPRFVAPEGINRRRPHCWRRYQLPHDSLARHIQYEVPPRQEVPQYADPAMHGSRPIYRSGGKFQRDAAAAPAGASQIPAACMDHRLPNVNSGYRPIDRAGGINLAWSRSVEKSLKLAQIEEISPLGCSFWKCFWRPGAGPEVRFYPNRATTFGLLRNKARSGAPRLATRRHKSASGAARQPLSRRLHSL